MTSSGDAVAGGRGWRGWVADRRLRTKMLASVVVAVFGAGVLLWSGVAALRSTSASATSLYAHTALPLADLAKVRDGIGDARGAIRDLAVTGPSGQGDLLGQIHDADQMVDSALAAYVADHGGTLDASRTTLVDKARTGLTAWRQIRDTQIIPAAQRG